MTGSSRKAVVRSRLSSTEDRGSLFKGWMDVSRLGEKSGYPSESVKWCLIVAGSEGLAKGRE